MKVGSGWEHVGGPVWEHPRYGRIHTMGLLIDSSGVLINGMLWPVSYRLRQCIRMHGGNRRRGAMKWARSLFEEYGFAIETPPDKTTDSLF